MKLTLVVLLATVSYTIAAPRAYAYYAPFGHHGGLGHIAKTPEVAHAEAEHFAEHARRGNYIGQGYHYPANINVLPNGYLADTPEVAHAKAAHFAEKAKIAHKPYSQGAYGPSYDGPSYGGQHYNHQQHHHIPAQVHVLPSGHLADTPEVAHAKAAHFAEKHKAAAAAAAQPDYQGYASEDSHAYAEPASDKYAEPSSGKYSGPFANPIIGPSGFLEDTPEVAHAKAAHLALTSSASHY